MDKQTEALLIESEHEVIEAEAVVKHGIASDDDLARAIAHCYIVGKDVAKLEARRKEKNAKPQEAIRKNTAIFKPLSDRADNAKAELRLQIFEYLAPGGQLGNMQPEDVKSFGENGLGVASLASIQDYEYDLVTIAKHHPELLKVDRKAVEAMFKAGNAPKGVTPIPGLQLRIT